MEFEWDSSKEFANWQKHRCQFTEASECFFDSNGFSIVDSDHSENELRFYWVGKSLADRVMTVRFTIRENKIRIIGCAEWRKFRRLYLERTKA